ncbi:MAG: tryptophan 7-halogenase [Alphaproteobacteria bacterium]
MSDFDVLIVGAGPAGCATALSLASFAPRLGIGLIDAPRDEAPRIGETVPPQIASMLAHLGIGGDFMVDRHHASYRTLSAWGSPALASNEFLFQVNQTGWRLDRARFDAMMRRAAARNATAMASNVVKLDHVEDGWRIWLADGGTRTARAVVDATGRAAVLARLAGERVTRHDRLASVFAFCADRGETGDLMIEAMPDGWWYTAALPDRRRIVSFMSDTDIIRRLGIGSAAAFRAALGETLHVAGVVSDAPLDTPQIQGAGSQIVAHDGGGMLIAVGDAASCFDPLSGQGIVKALRSGVFASYAIADRLERNDSDGMYRYAALVRAEYAAYQTTLRDFYGVERRFADRPFWARRHAGPAHHPSSRAAAEIQESRA